MDKGELRFALAFQPNEPFCQIGEKERNDFAVQMSTHQMVLTFWSFNLMWHDYHRIINLSAPSLENERMSTTITCWKVRRHLFKCLQRHFFPPRNSLLCSFSDSEITTLRLEMRSTYKDASYLKWLIILLSFNFGVETEVPRQLRSNIWPLRYMLIHRSLPY